MSDRPAVRSGGSDVPSRRTTTVPQRYSHPLQPRQSRPPRSSFHPQPGEPTKGLAPPNNSQHGAGCTRQRTAHTGFMTVTRPSISAAALAVDSLGSHSGASAASPVSDRTSLALAASMYELTSTNSDVATPSSTPMPADAAAPTRRTSPGLCMASVPQEREVTVWPRPRDMSKRSRSCQSRPRMW